jgi:hypothetical protein
MVFSTKANEHHNFDQFIKSFYDQFSQRELKQVSEKYFHPNAQFVFGNHIMVPGSAKEIESVFQSIMESLEKDGYQKSSIQKIHTNYTGYNYVVATIYFHRFKKNGEKLDSMCSTYSAAKLEDTWKILTWLPSKPEKADSCF